MKKKKIFIEQVKGANGIVCGFCRDKVMSVKKMDVDNLERLNDAAAAAAAEASAAAAAEATAAAAAAALAVSRFPRFAAASAEPVDWMPDKAVKRCCSGDCQKEFNCDISDSDICLKNINRQKKLKDIGI